MIDFPIDCYGIKEIGVERWMENYYTPVFSTEFHAINSLIIKHYVDTINKFDNQLVYWIAVSNKGLITNTITNYIVESIKLLRLREKGYEYLIGKEGKQVLDSTAISSLTDLNFIRNQNELIQQISMQDRIKSVLRTIKYNIGHFSPLQKNILSNLSVPVFFIGTRSQDEVVAYCREKNISPIQLHPMVFCRSDYRFNRNDAQFSKMLDFVNSFFELVRGQNAEITDKKPFELLRKETEEFFVKSFLVIKDNLRIIKKINSKKLLATGIGKPFNRLVLASWRLAEREVIGFTHGNSFYRYTPGVIKYFSLVNQYVVLSEGSKKIHKKAAQDFSYGLKMGEPVTFANYYYSMLFDKLQQIKKVRKIKKVMLVGGKMALGFYPWVTGSDAYPQIDLSIRLVRLLKSHGYTVLYKPHPVWMRETQYLFKDSVDMFLMNRFEDEYEKADCIIFGDATSSTFGFSLLTNKPIVLINIEGNFWYPRVLELLKKRCSVIDSSIDCYGKVILDQKRVIDAVKSSVKNINYDILHEFAF